MTLREHLNAHVSDHDLVALWDCKDREDLRAAFVALVERVMPAPVGAAETPTQQFDGATVCMHGTAMDVHCCNCHSGFLFDVDSCVCTFDELASREADPGRSGLPVRMPGESPSDDSFLRSAPRSASQDAAPAETPRESYIKNLRESTQRLAERAAAAEIGPNAAETPAPEPTPLAPLLDRIERAIDVGHYSVLRAWLAIHGGASARIVLEEVTQLVREFAELDAQRRRAQPGKLLTMTSEDYRWCINLQRAEHAAFSLVVDYLRKATEEIAAQLRRGNQ